MKYATAEVLARMTGQDIKARYCEKCWHKTRAFRAPDAYPFGGCPYNPECYDGDLCPYFTETDPYPRMSVL